MTRRVVFIHPDGLPMICGCLNEGEEPPVAISLTFSQGGHTYNGAHLKKVTERAAYYEVAKA